MRVSYRWLSEYVDLSSFDGPEAVADRLTDRGLEVEEVTSLAAGFEKVVVAQVKSKEKHPDADRLSVCKVDAGQGEPLDIVCGAQNFKAGDNVALAQVGANLPNGLKIKSGKIRGQLSNGMLCSEEELCLADESEGIMILDANAELGTPVADLLGRNDTVFELKPTPNRGDCLSHFGLARDLAAALGQKITKPKGESVPQKGASFRLELNAGEDCPQFWICEIEGVQVGPSPEWLVQKLEAIGARSINNVVDATNFVLNELGQPVHAYDADLLEGGLLAARMSQKGESLPLLDGTSVTLTGEELLIADANKPVGLAGVMGGGNSEVNDGTKRVVLECAEFAASRVRKTASRFQKHTDAAYRYERGIDPLGQEAALARLAQVVIDVAGGKIVGGFVNRLPSRENFVPAQVEVEPGFVPRYLGMDDLTLAETKEVLEGLNCRVAGDDSKWTVTIPSYRWDLRIAEDLTEEVARSVGYDRIPATVPKLTNEPALAKDDPHAEGLAILNSAKDGLAALGLMESVNFSFSSRTWLEKFDLASTAPVANPLSEEHEVLVPSLLPGLLKNYVDNRRHHFGGEVLPVRLFEIRPTFAAPGDVTATGEGETGVTETWKLSAVLTGNRFAEALRADNVPIDFYDVRALVDALFEKLGTRGYRYSAMDRGSAYGAAHLFHPGKSAEVRIGKDVAGCFGMLHPGLAKKLKLRDDVWAIELDWDIVKKLSRSATAGAKFKAWSEFPGIERDFAIEVRSETQADRILQLAIKAGKPLAKKAKIFDVYRGSQVSEGMTSVAVRVIFSEEGRSLQEAEADQASQKILSLWKKELGAELRG